MDSSEDFRSANLLTMEADDVRAFVQKLFGGRYDAYLEQMLILLKDEFVQRHRKF